MVEDEVLTPDSRLHTIVYKRNWDRGAGYEEVWSLESRVESLESNLILDNEVSLELK